MITLKRQNYKKNTLLYKKIEASLRNDLHQSIPIDHVGSTAIPNMYGKNIIDILIGANDSKQFEMIQQTLEKHSYIASKSNDSIYQFFASTGSETKTGDIHIHLVIKNTNRYDEFIILKKYLISNSEEAKNYSNFKRDLVKRDIVDRSEYKELKSAYVTDLLKRAKKE